MDEVSDYLKWSLDATEYSGETRLPLIRSLPSLIVEPKKAKSLQTLLISSSDNEPFSFNPSTFTDPFNKLVTRAKLKNLRCKIPVASCNLRVAFTTVDGDSFNDKVLSIPTRIPLVVPNSSLGWQRSDIRLERREAEIRQGGEKHRANITDLVNRLKSLKRATIWFEGDPGSGKTTFVDQLAKTLGTVALPDGGKLWCIVHLDGRSLGSQEKSIEMVRKDVIEQIVSSLANSGCREIAEKWAHLPEPKPVQGENFHGFLEDAIEYKLRNRLVVILDEYDVCSITLGKDTRELLSFIRNWIARPLSELMDGAVVLVVDQLSPDLRDFEPIKDETHEHWRFSDYFTIDDVNYIFGQLIELNHSDAVASRIWTWTRGQPTLVNSFVYQYVQEMMASPDISQRFADRRACVEVIDKIAYSQKTEEHVEHVVCLKLTTDGNTLLRLTPEEISVLRGIAKRSRYLGVKSYPEDQALRTLIDKGILKNTVASTSDDSFVVSLPVVRIHLPSILQKIGTER